MVLVCFAPVAWASGAQPARLILVDDFSQQAPRNQLGGNFGAAAKGGETEFSFDSRGIPYVASDSFLKIKYHFEKNPGYGFVWMKLGPSRGGTDSEYLDLRGMTGLSFKYRADDSIDFKVELHEDRDGDHRFTPAQDKSTQAYLRKAATQIDLGDGWKKAFIPLEKFGKWKIKDESKVLEIVFVFEKEKSGGAGEVLIDDLIFSDRILSGKEKRAAPVEMAKSVQLRKDGKKLKSDASLLHENRFEISFEPGKDFSSLESLALEIQTENDPVWHEATASFSVNPRKTVIPWAVWSFDPPHSFSLRFVARDAYGNSEVIAGPYTGLHLSAMNDEEFLNLIEQKTFLYFLENQNPDTGLFLDTAWAGDASIAVTGFGLSALVIGAERGWISKEEAKRRAELCLDTFLKKTESRDGFFYHFLDPKTGKRAGRSEISSVDTALLLGGVLTAGEYFGGSVKRKAGRIYGHVNWLSFLNPDPKDKNYLLFHQNWKPETGYSSYYWHDYSDEVLLIALLAVGSPVYPAPPEVYERFKKEKGRYAKGHPFVLSWHGGLFSYQYAHCWFYLKDVADRSGINWWKNSTDATLASRRFTIDESSKYQTYGRDSWGITSMWVPHQYVMHYGGLPNAQQAADHDGTISPSGAAGSIIFTPYLSLRVLKNLYLHHPQLWGPYGFKDSINLDRNWVSPMYYGLGEGVILAALENFRSGLLWKYFMANREIKAGLNRIGFVPDPSAGKKKRKKWRRLEELQSNDLDSGRRYLKEKEKLFGKISKELKSKNYVSREKEALWMRLLLAESDQNESKIKAILNLLAENALESTKDPVGAIDDTLEFLNERDLSVYSSLFLEAYFSKLEAGAAGSFRNFLFPYEEKLLEKKKFQEALSMAPLLAKTLAHSPARDERFRKFEEDMLTGSTIAGLHRQVLDYLDQAIHPEMPQERRGYLHFMRGVAYGQMGKTSEAIAEFETALQGLRNPYMVSKTGERLVRLYHQLPNKIAKSKIRSLMRRRQAESAIQAAGHFVLGMIYLREKNNELARSQFELIQKRFPNTPYSQLASQQQGGLHQ